VLRRDRRKGAFLRLTTKVWIITSVVVLSVVVAGSALSIQRQVDQRVEEAQQSNRIIYTVAQALADRFAPPYAEGSALPFSLDQLQSLAEARVANLTLVEGYGPDGSRVLTTNPASAPASPDAEPLQEALHGSNTSFTWAADSGPEGGHRVNDLSLFRILKGGEFAQEYWMAVSGPDGQILAVGRLRVDLPGLHDAAVAIVLSNALMGGALLIVLGVALWLTLHALVRRPLAELTSTTRRIREGEISVRAPTLSKDELGELAISFNTMADELERQATTDPITGLLNHRYGHVCLDDALQRGSSRGDPLSILLGDIAGFKLFNDTYGHALGDEVLRLVAGVLRQIVGSSGILSRYGGDTFLVILPGADKAAAGAFAGRLAAAVGEIEFQAGDGTRVPISLSLGLASFPEDAESKDHLLAVADAATYEAKRLGAVDRKGPRVIAAGEEGVESVFGTLDSLVQAIQYRDRYTKTHSDLVAEYAAKLSLEVGLSDEAVRAIRIAGVLHDVGKLIVPDDILKKPGPLTEEEYDVIKRHPLVGEMLIREAPFLEDVIQAVGCHHEAYDGSGYPRGLQGDDIPLLGRVMAIADAYSAMCLDRPYRRALSADEIIAELQAGAGAKFDPRLVNIFIEMLKAERRAQAA
jgi:diguanylate cyclase (GGDEF)-like protein